MTLLSAIEVARLVGRSERTVRNWLASGELQADKLHGVWRIEKDVALRVAQDMAGRARATPAPPQRDTEGDAALTEALRQLAAHVEALQAHVVSLEAQLADAGVKKRTELHVVTPGGAGGGWSAPGSSVQGREFVEDASAFSARRRENTREYSRGTGGTGGALPTGLVAWRPFVVAHGIPSTTVIYRIERGEIPLVRGSWKVGRAIVEQVFDATGRREFWRYYHAHPTFTPCEQCPHTLPTLPVDAHALDGIDAATLAEFEEEE